MMIPIKIQCGGCQKHTFEIEPVDGQMPWAVACPFCGMDGTTAANSSIAQTLVASAPVQAAAAPPPPPVPPRLVARLAVQTSTRSITRRLPGQIDPNQALIEARAKISWGDEPVEVVKFLMIQCFSREEAKEHVWEMFAERVKAVRSNGVGKSSSASAWPACPSLDCSCSCCWDSSCSRFLRS